MNDPADRRRAARAIAWVLLGFILAVALAGGLIAGCLWQALVNAARL